MEKQRKIKGYITDAKYLWGVGYRAIERKFGFPNSSLRSGFGIYRLKEIPRAEQILVRPYSQIDEELFARQMGLDVGQLEHISEKELSKKYKDIFGLDLSVLKRNALNELEKVGIRNIVKIIAKNRIIWPGNESFIGEGIPQWKLISEVHAELIKEIPADCIDNINCI